MPSNDLAESLANYKNATITNNVDGILSFVYPSVFKLIPQAKLKSMLTQMYASGSAPVIKDIQFEEVGAIQSYDQGTVFHGQICHGDGAAASRRCDATD